MPAYFDTGFSVRQPMWHGEGMIADDYPEDWKQARVWAGLEWEPRLAPVYAKTEAVITDDGVTPATYLEVPSHKLVTRDDTGAPLGIVSDKFELVPHSVMGEILEALCDDPLVRFETAGSCKGGSNVWAVIYLDEPATVAGDDTATYPFAALLNNHDGSGACKLVRTSVRVVCWNTYQAASMQGQRTGLEFTFRHTSGVLDRIQEAREALSGMRAGQTAWIALADELAAMPVNAAQVKTFEQLFIPEPAAEIVSARVRKNIDQARATFAKLHDESVTTDGHRGTALGLVDAAVEYLDHVRGFRNRDTYMGRTLLRAEPLKANAVQLAREVASELVTV